MRIAYFVHDLSDPAVDRRVRMLRAGGAEVVLLGFRRSEMPVRAVAGVDAVDLGRTHNARMGHRAALTLARAMNPRRWRALLSGCDAVIGRNLEMLVLAARARDACAPSAALVYECLDIHRLMLRRGPLGGALRALERALLARCRWLMVSSPAFVEAYFEPRQSLATPWLLVENKVFAAEPAPLQSPPAGPPWRIGWFGMIRCRRSLEMLSTLAGRLPDRVEVVIRGIPSDDVFGDFQACVAGEPNVTFEGPYRSQDLAQLYAAVHFTWAVDYFDAGENSDWLLPNRLYEGALYGSVSLARAGVESGRWVAAHSAGLALEDPLEDAAALLRDLTPQAYAALAQEVRDLPRADLAVDEAECRALVAQLTLVA